MKSSRPTGFECIFYSSVVFLDEFTPLSLLVGRLPQHPFTTLVSSSRQFTF